MHVPVLAWGSRHGKGQLSLAELCSDQSLVAETHNDLTKRSKAAGLKGFELPKVVTLWHTDAHLHASKRFFGHVTDLLFVPLL